MTEAKEVFGKMLRWTEAPKDAAQAEKTVYLGPVVHGYYIGRKEGVGQNESSVYDVQLIGSGELVSFWGSDLLDGKFQEIPLNCEVRVTCLGIQQPKKQGGRAYMGFKVEYDKDSRKPMTEAAVATPVAPTAPAQPSTTVPPQTPSNQGF